MLDRRLLTTIMLSIGTVLLMNYFMDRSPKLEVGHKLAPGQACKAPINEEIKPLNRNIVFSNSKMTTPEEISVIDTGKARYSFSTYGGQLAELEFINHLGKNKTPLKTLYKKKAAEQDQGSFLVALDDQTPFIYELEDRIESNKTVTLVYAAHAGYWTIRKSFTVHKDCYKLDLKLQCIPQTAHAKAIKPRLFMAAPYVNELTDDAITGVVLNASGKALDRVETTKEAEFFWAKPGLVGTEDKYFAHMLVSDASSFVGRAYFKRENARVLATVLEGNEIAEEATYNLSFYCGPKLFHDLNAVHERLEDLLNFGWLSALCKLLLRLLTYLYNMLGNYGFAIIALTILVKLPFLPLSINAKRRLEEYSRYQPAINRIRTKFAHDIKLQHEEVMKFHREHNISPTTQIFGCLPLLVQMPILFGLYRILGNYLDLYQSPFMGWIFDLSSRDPFYVLPILMGLSMLWQQHLTPAADGKQRVIGIFMSFLMVAIFASFPAGLVLYWFINNVVSIAEDLGRKAFFA